MTLSGVVLYCFLVYGMPPSCPFTHDDCIDLKVARLHAGLQDGICIPVTRQRGQPRWPVPDNKK